jgi:hypothetical protein
MLNFFDSAPLKKFIDGLGKLGMAKPDYVSEATYNLVAEVVPNSTSLGFKLSGANNGQLNVFGDTIDQNTIVGVIGYNVLFAQVDKTSTGYNPMKSLPLISASQIATLNKPNANLVYYSSGNVSYNTQSFPIPRMAMSDGTNTFTNPANTQAPYYWDNIVFTQNVDSLDFTIQTPGTPAQKFDPGAGDTSALFVILQLKAITCASSGFKLAENIQKLK